MWEHRLDAATTLLKSHPTNPVIVTGGTSSQCPDTSEAQAMKKALQERGVTNRVILENKAWWNTLQNVEYTAGTISSSAAPPLW
ncbi:MAG TPA: YdcF family protein [Candidatus Corynebacterium avicola]|uniref:YdcF family protein n=1 Tax=Candidatus Corynebacterium avicola TaxID=2838527 RepID=A0A9D1UM79_9CORY|nr:YdcF family protein [Candidatus Corynebacterium avicola]